MWSVGRTILTGENPCSGKETCPSATVSTTNPHFLSKQLLSTDLTAF